ncbi:MAG: DUF2807 domain-containing protein [Alphaproteobacteria bacterium]|nr:MAG: DUF2807 domain-containing protein [Alphaproteobacteria bacterium]
MRLLLATAIITATAAAVAAIGLAAPPADAEVRTYNLAGFTKIEASAAFDIVFTQSPTYSVVIDSRHDGLHNIIVEKVGDTLRITRPKDKNIKGQIDDVVRISAPTLEALKFDAAIEFEADTLKVNDLTITAQAAVEIDIKNLQARNITIDAASEFDLAGTCNKLDATLGTASELTANKLKCRETRIEAGFASNAHAYASEKAIANAGMASTVRISGRPRDFTETHDRFDSKVSLAD